MTSQLNPYLTFNGNARQAMEFYQSVFGGELKFTTFGEFGDPGQAPADGIMHSQLNTPRGYVLMASDTGPGMPLTQGNSITCSLSGDQGEGIEEAWTRLSDGGQVNVPFDKQMWGDMFGMCVDKFGTPWMVNVVAPQ